MALSALLIALDVVLRVTVGRIVFESFEITGYALAAAVALSLSHATFEKAHIRIDVVWHLAPRPLKTLMNLVAIAALAAVSVVLAMHGTETFLESIAFNAHSRSPLRTPLAIPQGFWAAGLVWFAVSTTIVALAGAFWILRRKLDAADRLLSPASVSEIVEEESARPQAGRP